MTPVDVRAVALLSLALGAALGYSLQKRENLQAKDRSTLTQGEKESKSPDEKSIRLVVQRFRKASLVVEDSKIVTVGKDTSLLTTDANEYSGILVYASFAKSATKEKVMQAAKTIMNLPVLTRGVWGDVSDPVSVLDTASSDGGVAVLLVPQANLFCKVRSQGRSIQYHGQLDKAAGQSLYEHLVDCISAIALEHQCTSRGDPAPKFLTEFGKPGKVDASLPPIQLFRDPSQYSSWDALGIPQCDQNGEPLTKSALKKLRKLYESQKKRHEKYMNTAPSGTEANASDVPRTSSLDPSFVHVVPGSFGKRQGLEISSDMGPFCHALDL